MMAQDPQSLEQMLTSLERPLRVLGGLCHAPVPDEVKELRRAARSVLPPPPLAPTPHPHPPRGKSGLALTRALPLTPTLFLRLALTLTLILTLTPP